MIGTIRKHSKVLWWTIGGLTVISFIGWNIAPASRNSGGGGAGDFGTLYGRKITQQDYINARNDFYLLYWFQHREWPNQDPNMKKQQLEEQIYYEMMLTQKASALDVHVSDQAAATAASRMLQSVGRNGQSVPIEAFVRQVLQPAGMTAADFERFARDDVAVRQLVQILGLPGVLITPQEAAAAYQRAFQKELAQIVFFSASNYLSQVTVTPAAVAQYYTNYLAQYRLPERVQVYYVEFNVSNYLAQSKAEWAKTNLEENVNAEFTQYGMSSFPKAKTADEAKAIIREDLIRRRALFDARTQANAFATKVFNMDPVKAQNLVTVAKQEGLTVHLTAPFSSLYGPEEFIAPAEFTKDAFALTTDNPFSLPIVSDTGVYVIALAKQLPSEIPSLDSIRDQVTQDYRMEQATILAQRAGTNFAPALAHQLTAGHTFASACVAAGLHPMTLPPFSLSTSELPELGDRAEFLQVKQAVFSTPVGHASGFAETADGGFIVYVQSRLPVDQAAMKADLPQFTSQLRVQRADDVFNRWIQTEASQQFSTIPAFKQQTTGGAE